MGKIASLGTAAGKAQGKLAGLQALTQAVGNASNSIGSGIREGMERRRKEMIQKQQAIAAGNIGARLGIDQDTAAEIGPEPMFRMFQNQQLQASEAKSREALEGLRHRHASERLAQEFRQEHRAAMEEAKLTMQKERMEKTEGLKQAQLLGRYFGKPPHLFMEGALPAGALTKELFPDPVEPPKPTYKFNVGGQDVEVTAEQLSGLAALKRSFEPDEPEPTLTPVHASAVRKMRAGHELTPEEESLVDEAVTIQPSFMSSAPEPDEEEGSTDPRVSQALRETIKESFPHLSDQEVENKALLIENFSASHLSHVSPEGYDAGDELSLIRALLQLNRSRGMEEALGRDPEEIEETYGPMEGRLREIDSRMRGADSYRSPPVKPQPSMPDPVENANPSSGLPPVPADIMDSAPHLSDDMLRALIERLEGRADVSPLRALLNDG